ncbi:ferrienterobactin ABC transporter ATPase [Bacteroidales bacterium]|nr:ferrienterobactin ABC transporter ATPase [Bacteroidales bacterium]
MTMVKKYFVYLYSQIERSPINRGLDHQTNEETKTILSRVDFCLDNGEYHTKIMVEQKIIKGLTIKDLSCGYKDDFQLEGIKLAFPKGVFAGIIGPNGSGKSTLFKGIVGDLQLSKGSVWIDDKNLALLSLKEKARLIAVVSQFAELAPITVQEYVSMGRIPYHKAFQFYNTPEDKEIVSHYLNLTGISHLRHKAISQLSGGELQMASIACALSQQTGLLLLDEPTSHLDIAHQYRIMNLLQKLNQEQELTIIMIIHDLNLASEYCKHLTLIKNGKIIHEGTPTDVLTYQNIEKVYEAVVVVKNNPISNKPFIFPISEQSLNKSKI